MHNITGNTHPAIVLAVTPVPAPTDLDSPKPAAGPIAGSLSQAAGAGTLPSTSASLDGINWDMLAADVNTTDTMSIKFSDIMVLLIKTMATMRKGQRDAWLTDAQNALAMGLNAADRMRESAVAKLASDVISNGTAMITAGVSMGMTVGSMVNTSSVTQAVESEANAMEQAMSEAEESAMQQVTENLDEELESGAKSVNGKNGSGIGKLASEESSLEEAMEKMEEEQGAKTNSSSLANKSSEASLQDSVEKMEEEQEDKSNSTATKQKTSEESTLASSTEKMEAVEKGDPKSSGMTAAKARLKMWKTEEIHRRTAPFQHKVDIATKGLEIATAAMKITANVSEYLSQIKQAEAQEARARGEYFSNISQVELDFANELRDTIKSAIDAMQSVEASRHQAMQGIYNI